MPSFSSLEISGYRDHHIANTFIRQEDETAHLGVVFPGIGYTAAMPVCYYPGLVLRSLGADLLNLETAYARSGFSNLGEAEQAAWLLADAAAALTAALKQRRYTRVTLVGKSLGTVATAALLEGRSDLPISECIWLTPVLRSAQVCRWIAAGKPRGLLAIGAADSYYRPELIAGLERGLGRKALVFPGADHSLEIQGDPAGTVRVIAELVNRVMEFLAL
ncbi:MAG TPA: hypothetical protein VMT46_03690 [Anaerolineaceae bacterium]|nr:hypothetical protein [Anaerolineaceae bacterium]